MKILHVSSCPPSGGAARAAIRIHKCLQEAGKQSTWLQANYTLPDLEGSYLWSNIKKKPTVRDKIAGSLKKQKSQKKTFASATTFSSFATGFGDDDGFERYPIPDIYNFHWVSNFLDWKKGLLALALKKPIVWTLHDLNTTMGVWHYDPTENETTVARKAIDQEIWRLKKAVFDSVPTDRITFVAPSKWMADRCRNSELTNRFRCVHIPNAVDTEIFKPIKKQSSKEALGIPEGATLIGFVADSVDDPRKGMKTLQEAVDKLHLKKSAMILTVGRIQQSSNKIRQINLGNVQSDLLLRHFYNACDLFVCPSTQDNLPNTVLESMACGTPVIGSDVGGIPDMVINERTGMLATSGDSQSFTQKINYLIDNPQLRISMGVASRTRIKNIFSNSKCASAYIALYEEILRINS